MADNNPVAGETQAQQAPEASTLESEEAVDKRYVHVDGRVQIELDDDSDPDFPNPDRTRVKMTFLDVDFKPIPDQVLFFYLDEPIKFRYVNLMPNFIRDGFENSRSTLEAVKLIKKGEKFEDLEKSSGAPGMTSSGKPKPTP